MECSVDFNSVFPCWASRLLEHLPNRALQRTTATELVCQVVRSRWLPRLLGLGVRRGQEANFERT